MGRFEEKATKVTERDRSASSLSSFPSVQDLSFLFVSFACFVVLLSCRALGQDAPSESGLPPVVVDYFYEPGCADCYRVRDNVMPELRERFEGFHELRKWDLGIKSSVVRLIAYQERLGVVKGESVSMYVDYQHVLNGYAAIERGLFRCLDEAVAARMEPGWEPPEPIPMPELSAEVAAGERMKAFALGAVLLGGLADGVNPCAISTLVFFMSLLATAKVRGRRLLLMGISFCAATFATYMAIGFGLLRFLHLFEGFKALRTAVEILMVAALAVLAFLSFRDALRYRASHDAHDVTLQLPKRVKLWTHAVMRRGLRSHHLILAGLAIGSAVTALESVCTGQVYVPTLMVVVKGGFSAKAWGYLLAYNLMFVVPLVVVFAAVYLGLRTEELLKWSRREVVWAKVALGALFLAMAGAILWL